MRFVPKIRRRPKVVWLTILAESGMVLSAFASADDAKASAYDHMHSDHGRTPSPRAFVEVEGHVVHGRRWTCGSWKKLVDESLG